MIDNGFPLTTEPNILREMIAPPNIVNKMLSVVTGNTSNVSDTLPNATASCVPWRTTDVKYANNEVYVDLAEEMDAIINRKFFLNTFLRDGVLVKCEIYGEVQVNSHITGVPDLTLSFTNPSILDEVRFHPCVRFRPWESNQILSFVPPDGLFKLMSYRVKKLKSIPLYVKPQFTSDAGTCRVNVMVGIRNDPGKLIDSITVQFALPPCISSADLTSNHGTVTILANKMCSWTIDRIPKDRAPALSGTLVLEHGLERLHVFPVFQVGFRIQGVAISGLQIDKLDLKVVPSRLYKGFRALTRGGHYELLNDAVVRYCGSPVGTVAANDPNDKQPLNYDQVFIRDFVPSALAFLLRGEGEIVRNFLLHTLQLQSWEKTVDCYSPGQGLMPASFKVRTVPLDENKSEEVLDPDFGESAIGRVAPVDSGLWWIILLRAYGKITGDYALQERVDVQTGIKLILNLCLTDGFDMFPSLLVTDGSCMIDRRMGIHGHPLEIQALFYSALRCSREMLTVNDGSKNLIRAINNRLSALSFHIREYYWVDMRKINEIYRYKTEEYSMDATNKFNIYPEQIPSWLMDWIPEEGGYMIGNLQPAHMDFRFFTLGNLWSVVSSLGTPKQNEAILNLIEAKWDDLVGHMPMKICYPALEFEDWRIITGSDPKNTPWSYHNGGSWPTLLWQFTLACIKMGRTELAQKAVSLAEKRLAVDRWPEYYDTRTGKFIGKQSRLYQTWTIAGFLTSKVLLENPEMASLLCLEEDYELLEICVCALNKTGRKKCSRILAKSQILV